MPAKKKQPEVQVEQKPVEKPVFEDKEGMVYPEQKEKQDAGD